MLFGRGGEAENIPLRVCIRERLYGDHGRGAAGQRPRLVKGDRIYFGKALKSICPPDQNAALREVGDCRCDGGWRRQDERAGAENNECGDRADELPCAPPDCACTDECSEDEAGCPAVGEADDGGLLGIDVACQRDHALEGGIRAGPLRTHREDAIGVDRTAHDRIARMFVDGEGFSRHHRCVDGGLSLGQNAVDGDRLARMNPKQIAAANLANGQKGLFPIAEDMRCLRDVLEQALDTLPRAVHRPVLEQGTELHDEGNLACGEVFLRHDGRNERDGNENARADVKAV